MDFGKLIFFAIALSLDAFSAGFAYGLRRIKIPLVSYCALICASMFIVGLSVFFGSAVAQIIPPVWGEKLGGMILLGIGLWWLFRPRNNNKNINQEDEKVKKVVELRLASLAVIIQIFEEPVCADIDASGVISIQESLFLAFALSVDALGAVFGAALAGSVGIQTVLFIAIFQLFFLLLGVYLGRSSTFMWMRTQGPVIAGLLLCMLGLLKIF
ncbi:MAG: sporulation membrane protein YtaF [Syntrophaceticus schinkii]|nr:sporulation membrane protein YtaF [Syntrophaceticus schinkii]MDD4261949.1 sporulation membrane protein YtaF [Syntrophaceticus schinkii]MDD4674161.1 sporulation membrane protein YtaF [Syntrophaceticus schinkii]